jgi:hypothetical protein
VQQNRIDKNREKEQSSFEIEIWWWDRWNKKEGIP